MIISRSSYGLFALQVISACRAMFCLLLLLILTFAVPAKDLNGQNRSFTDDIALVQNKPIERELSGGGAHFYTFTAEAAEFVRLVVDQRGIDVVVKLFAPDGKLLTEVDSPNGESGPEPLDIILEAKGVYRLSVSSLEKDAKPGRYEAKLLELRPATEIDKHLIAARKSANEGLALYQQRTPQSLERSLEKYEESLGHYIASGDKNEQFNAILSLGGVARVSGKLEKALEYAKRALQFAETHRNKSDQAKATGFFAAIYQNSGELEKTLKYAGESLRLYQAIGDKTKEADQLKVVGIANSYLGEQEKARGYLFRAIKIYEALGNKLGEGLSYRAIGYSYSIEDKVKEAIDNYAKALSVWEPYDDADLKSMEHSFLSNEYARLGNKDQALYHAEQAIRLRATKGNFDDATLLTNVAHTYKKFRNFEKALTYYRAALTVWQNQNEKRSEAITLRHIAAVFRDQGQLAEALTTMERSIALLEFMRDNAGSPESRSSFVASLYEYYEFYIDLKMRTNDASPSATKDAEVLEFVEKIKMRSLVELLTTARVDLSPGVNVKLRERERKVNEGVTAKLDELSKLLRGKFTEAQKTAAEREVDKFKDELAQVQAEIRKNSPHYAAFAVPQPLSVKDIQQQVLDENTILLEYSLGTERSYLWAVTKDSVQSFRLPPRAEIEAQVRRVYELITARQRGSGTAADEAEYSAQAIKLSQTLIAPVAAQLGTKRLLVVADGALQYLPFAVLPKPTANSQPLLIDHEIVSLPSASVLEVLRREYGKRQPAPRMAAVFADPVYATDDSRVRPVPSSVRGNATRSNFQRLLFSRTEAKTILAVTPSQSNLLAMDFESNRQMAMSPEMGKYRIIHFSTHGTLDSHKPELSGLVLSQVTKTGEPQEGFLRLHEIYKLRLNADLVVLSACQTGLGKDVRGEGLIGLTRGFMYAGVPRIVASLWQVDDAATAALMKEFYRSMLVRKLSPAAALRSAQMEMLRKKAWQSPYYWGAFVLQGEWK